MKKTLVALLLVLVIALPVALTACNKGIDRTQWLGDAVERTDYTSVYDKYGASISIADVTENADGSATITKDGKTYTLGLDFLSMAMVYNCQVPAGSTKYHTEEDVYNEWWKLYILRWNKMVPEVPLYSNQYYDVFSSDISNLKTSPYWTVTDAIVGASTSKESKSVIIGDTTDLSGAFREAAFGQTSPGSSDLAVQNLTTGYSTMYSDFDGLYHWNMDVLTEEPTKTTNSDGTVTFTLKIKSGLLMSNGAEITADNYLAATIVSNTEIYGAAGGNVSGSIKVLGYDKFLAYNGTNEGQDVDGVKASKYFEGIKKLDDYSFSITISKDYATFYYANVDAALSPVDPAIYLCGATIEVDANKSVGLSSDFYKKEKVEGVDVYVNGAKLEANLSIANLGADKFAYTGPYVVKNYDEGNKTVTLSKNNKYVTETYRKFEGTTEGNIAEIKIIKAVEETQITQLKKGEINILPGITGGSETDAALALTKDGKFKEVHYDRAGYGKLAFKGDYGPTQFVEVRQAIMHSINRDEFARSFTGGHGTVVHGPYYMGSSAYEASKDILNSSLNKYAYSKDKAIELLKSGGWIYNADGSAYNEAKGGIRYKKLEGYELSKANLQYVSTDQKYGTMRVEKDGNVSYYMPLVINWFGTQPNSVTDLLNTSWASSKIVSEIGMYVTETDGTFAAQLYGEYYQIPAYGYNKGDHPNCSAVNFATGFTSAIYDMSLTWAIDPDLYMDNNMQLMDPADFWADYQN